MTCREVRDLADSFLGEELLTETNHEILRHLETCPSCRAEIDARRRLRGAVRTAFDRAPELQPAPDFAGRLRDTLRQANWREQRAWAPSRGWLALAAGVVLAAGVTVAVFLARSSATRPSASAALAQDAIGDHANCALQFRLAAAPIPLEEAATRFDSAYRLLLTAPPDDLATANGRAHVVERHSCVYGARRFGHVVLQYRGKVVSLLMTASDGSAGSVETDRALPHVIGRPMNGMSVVAVDAPRHSILLVSDLGSSDLQQLSTAVAMPLARQLEASATRTNLPLLAANAAVLFDRVRLDGHR
jgi:predicted anti-sigma-YlaC factor YlaD